MKKKIIIFGCGFHGRAVFRKFNQLKKSYQIIAWVDNNVKNKNKILFGKKIFLPAHLTKIDYDLILLSGRNIKLQEKQIKKITKKNKFKVLGNDQIKPNTKNIAKRNKSIKIILKYINNILTKKNIPFWADSSALLTIFRKDDLSIRSDFDISIDKKYLRIVKKSFESSMEFTFHKLVTPNKKIKIFFTSNNNNLEYEPVIVDIGFKIMNKKKYIYNYGNMKKKFPKKFFLSFVNYYYSGISIKVPFFSKEYLKYIYGNWRYRKQYFTNKLASKKVSLHQPFIF